MIDFKCSLYFPQYSTVLADKCFREVLGESKSKVKKVIWSKIVQFKVVEDDPDMPYFKYSYSDWRKNASLKKTIQGMLKWTEHQREKSINLKKESLQQRRKIY